MVERTPLLVATIRVAPVLREYEYSGKYRAEGMPLSA